MNRFQRWVLGIGGALSLISLAVFYFEVPWPISSTAPAVATALTLVLLALADENRTATAAGVVLLLIILAFGGFGTYVMATKGWNWKAVGIGAWLLFAALIGLHKLLMVIGIGLIDSAKSRRHQTLLRALGFCFILAGAGYLVTQTAAGFYKQDQLDRMDGILGEMEIQEERIQSQMDRLESRVSTASSQETLQLIQSQLTLAEQGLKISEGVPPDEKRSQRRILAIAHYTELADKHSQRLKGLVNASLKDGHSNSANP